VPIGGDRGVRDRALRLNLLAIHLPDIDLAAVLTPENVAVAIAVEIVDALDVPIARDRKAHDSALRLNLLAIHLPDIDLAAAVLTPENVAVAIAVEVTDALDVPIGGDWGVRDSALRLNLLAIHHLPDIDLAAAVLTPENVAVAIAVEIADALDVPIGGDWGVRDSALRLNLLAIHLPDIDLAAAVLPPENVAVAVTIEVADALDVPIVGDWGVRRTALFFDLADHSSPRNRPARCLAAREGRRSRRH
jgi:hypothetical protein